MHCGTIERAVNLDPTYVEARFNLARLLHAVDQRERAISEYQQVLKRRANFPEAHLGLGVALAEQGQTRAAVQEFLEVLRLRPDDAEAARNLELARKLEAKRLKSSP